MFIAETAALLRAIDKIPAQLAHPIGRTIVLQQHRHKTNLLAVAGSRMAECCSVTRPGCCATVKE